MAKGPIYVYVKYNIAMYTSHAECSSQSEVNERGCRDGKLVKNDNKNAFSLMQW